MTDIIHRITGDFGIWQLRAVLIIFLCKIPSSWFMACVIFTAPAPRFNEYYCADGLPEQEQPTGVSKFSLHDFYNTAGNYSHHDHCFKEQYNNVTNKYDEVPCTSFQYIPTDYWSLVTQFNLVCSREIFVAWTQFWHLFGVLMGGISATKLMLRFSPRNVMLMGMITQIFCGCITGMTSSFNIHCAFRCFSAMCCALMFTAGQTIFSEITGGKYRLGVATLFDQFWSIGVILLPGLSSFFSSWVHIYLAITFPTVILILLYPWIPDAPRWLLKRDRVEEVERILIESAGINDRMWMVPQNLHEELETLANSLKSEPPPANWWSLWTGPRAKTHLIAAHIAWTVYVTNFNGMLLNIRSFGREYLNINTIFTGISEILGCFLALFFALHTRNKWMSAGIYNIVAGLIGCLGWFISDEWSETTRVAVWMVLSSIPKAGVSISQSMLIAGTSELVPAPKRQIFTFSCIVVARIGLLTAPFINVLKNFDTALSLTAFCVLGLIGGIATCFLRSEQINTNDSAGTDFERNPNNLCASSTTEDIITTRNGIPSTINVWTTEPQFSEKTNL
ncbi:unnamed protein product [Hermetia illucens]|uniref:Uncharacterized protein n=1 Tax=Hermetia illucens TaxID=343691 RepID=A0A7R8V7B3_HERIL|nr:organic cation transporter protein-like [Hermetia illucens]XP_037924747.1 organic cation transporter protein-like [Hermetia illucens]XP_037924748.1 organic cation transporter protein-like [Hermetia illucens]CAD7093442.1 unnamed protein product [Hermetia illucens]